MQTPVRDLRAVILCVVPLFMTAPSALRRTGAARALQ